MQAAARKVVIHAAGGHDQLKLEETSVPAPGPGQVRIDVRAIGVNYADAIIRMGLYASAKEYVGWPITPGFEVAGTIGAVGEGVSDLAVGAPVFAVTRFGGYASHVVVDRAYVFDKPVALSFEQAAALPTVYMTAWYALFELAHPRGGAKIPRRSRARTPTSRAAPRRASSSSSRERPAPRSCIGGPREKPSSRCTDGILGRAQPKRESPPGGGPSVTARRVAGLVMLAGWRATAPGQRAGYTAFTSSRRWSRSSGTCGKRRCGPSACRTRGTAERPSPGPTRGP